MQIYIMRHGQAESFAPSDAQRKLTEQGTLEAKVMGKWLNDALQSEQVAEVFVSPYIRAQQTAQHVLGELNSTPNSRTLDFITPSGSALEFHDYLDGIAASEKLGDLLVVSHMPLVSYLVEELTVERSSPIFQTAAIAHIDYDLQRMKGHLVAMMSPSDIC